MKTSLRKMSPMSLILLILGFLNISFHWSSGHLITQKVSETLAVPNPSVNTSHGLIIGTKNESRDGREFWSFRGIPYAEPPVGQLRFKNPVPIKKPKKVINATQDAPMCIQKSYSLSNHPPVTGQEDCLYLNVYVPVTNESGLLPVMVYIPGGGYFQFSGRSDLFGPEYLMDENIILVTLNYRLGAFGFLTTLDDIAPGNLGLKDQVLVLKWVQENIIYFGGDKTKVTIAGQSAGSGSTALQFISPASQGLFIQVISQSGNSLNIWNRPTNALQPAVLKNQSDYVGCGQYVNNSTEVIACLQAVNATILANSSDDFKYFQIEPMTTYGVVTEIRTEANPDPFLEVDPLITLGSGNFTRVPYIVGDVEDEGIFRASSLLRQPDTRKQLNENFDAYLPRMLDLSSSTNNVTELWNQIVNFYLDGEHYVDVDNPVSVQNFINMYGDRYFDYGTYQYVNALLKNKPDDPPLYVYIFNYRGQYSYGNVFAATNDTIPFDWGVSHCDDLLYLFTSSAFFPPLEAPSDITLSKKMVQIWTSFVINGVPDPEWTPATYPNNNPENVEFLLFSGSSNASSWNYTMEAGFFPERMTFWQQLDIDENTINSY